MTALRRLPRWLGVWLDRARARVQALDAEGRHRLVAVCIAGLALLSIGVLLLLLLPPSTAGERERDSFLARMIPAPDQFGDRVSPAAARAARGLSVADKVDQLLLLGFEGTGAESVSRLPTGSDPGGVAVAAENYADRAQLRRLISDARARARRAGKPPPLVFVSQEGGNLSALADVPPDLTPADTASVEDAGEAALDSGKELERLGVNAVLGPLLDIGAPDGEPFGVRAFSDDAREVARYARATVSAYVGQGLISAPLHFPGLGGAPTSTDQGPAQIGQTMDQLRRFDLLPFRVAIDAGAQAIVVGHGLYGTDDFAVPASASRFILNDLLRQELGFTGLAITDDLAAGAITITQSPEEAAVASIAAGADMVRLSGTSLDQERSRTALIAAVRRGQISRERLDSAVMRVLETKRRARLIRGAARRREARRPGAAPRPPAARPQPPGREGRPPTPRAGGGTVEPPPPAPRPRERAPVGPPPPPAAPGKFPPPPPPAAPRERPPQAAAPQRPPIGAGAPRSAARIPGLNRREGRPPAPGGVWPPPPSEPYIPGLNRREGRPPGPGGVRQRDPSLNTTPGTGTGQNFVTPGGQQQVTPGSGVTTSPSSPGTTTYTLPR